MQDQPLGLQNYPQLDQHFTYCTEKNKRFINVVPPKKKKYIPKKTDEKELQEFRDHLRMINEKTRTIVEKYRKWWDKDTRTWKKGFKGHGKWNE